MLTTRATLTDCVNTQKRSEGAKQHSRTELTKTHFFPVSIVK